MAAVLSARLPVGLGQRQVGLFDDPKAVGCEREAAAGVIDDQAQRAFTGVRRSVEGGGDSIGARQIAGRVCEGPTATRHPVILVGRVTPGDGRRHRNTGSADDDLRNIDFHIDPPLDPGQQIETEKCPLRGNVVFAALVVAVAGLVHDVAVGRVTKAAPVKHHSRFARGNTALADEIALIRVPHQHRCCRSPRRTRKW